MLVSIGSSSVFTVGVAFENENETRMKRQRR